MSKVLVTGGSGSWGQELVRQLLRKEPDSEIVIYSRGEHRQVAMQIQFNNPRIKYIIGDVRDLDHLKEAAEGAHAVYHMAALKHVPVCEHNPEEAFKTNVQGTINAVKAATEANVETFVFVSTDKAVDPINVYGVSKSMAEKIVTNANLRSNGTKFVCVRGGNVLGTQGSVVPLFKEQLQRANELTITDPSMTRYMMRLQDAIGLVFLAARDSKGGEIFVMQMPSAKIYDVATLMIKELGNVNTGIRTIGIRPGEKLHETLVSQQEAERAFSYNQYYVILPTMDINGVYQKWNADSFMGREYTSANNVFLSEDELRSMLKAEGWLSKSSVADLQGLSQEELLQYFDKQGWSHR